MMLSKLSAPIHIHDHQHAGLGFVMNPGGFIVYFSEIIKAKIEFTLSDGMQTLVDGLVFKKKESTP